MGRRLCGSRLLPPALASRRARLGVSRSLAIRAVAAARPIRLTSMYAELHALTNFSFLKGASQPTEMVAMAAELGYSAIAITDECSLAGEASQFIRQQHHLLDGPAVRVKAGFCEPLHLIVDAARWSPRERQYQSFYL